MPIDTSMQGYLMKTLDDAAVDRIIAAVERTGHKAALAPASLDRGKLGTDLNKYWHQYQGIKFDRDARVHDTAAQKWLSDIVKCVEQLLKLLDQNNEENEPHVRNAILNLAFYRQPSMSIVNEILSDLKEGAVQVRDVV